jgi:hypothetical protein
MLETHHPSNEKIRTYPFVTTVLQNVCEGPDPWGYEVPGFPLAKVLVLKCQEKAVTFANRP